MKSKFSKRLKRGYAKNVSKETLIKKEHRLLVEGYGSQELLDIYDDLKELEEADLSDFLRLNGSDGDKL